MIYNPEGLGWSEIVYVGLRHPGIAGLLDRLCEHGRSQLAVKMARIMIDVR